jgi:hypothetical protein
MRQLETRQGCEVEEEKGSAPVAVHAVVSPLSSALTTSLANERNVFLDASHQLTQQSTECEYDATTRWRLGRLPK